MNRRLQGLGRAQFAICRGSFKTVGDDVRSL
jgi:hypothetical protein